MDNEQIIQQILKNGICLKGSTKVIYVTHSKGLFGEDYFTPKTGKLDIYLLSELGQVYIINNKEVKENG